MGTFEYTLTEEEQTLLNKMYSNSDNINKGQLYNHQTNAIDTYRRMTQYLEKKYPGIEYKVVTFDIKNFLHSQTRLTFMCDNNDTIYEVHAVNEEATVFEDNYYCQLITNIYNSGIETTLNEQHIICCTYTQISGMFGEDFRDALPFEQIPNTTAQIDTTVFVDIDKTVGSPENITSRIEKTIRALNQYGYHKIYFVHGLTDYTDNPNALPEIRQNKNVKSSSFNTFNLRSKKNE